MWAGQWVTKVGTAIPVCLLLFISKSVVHYLLCGDGAGLQAFQLCGERNINKGRQDTAGWRCFLLGSVKPSSWTFPTPTTWPPAAHMARPGWCSCPPLVQSVQPLQMSRPSPVTTSAGPSPQTLHRWMAGCIEEAVSLELELGSVFVVQRVSGLRIVRAWRWQGTCTSSKTKTYGDLSISLN